MFIRLDRHNPPATVTATHSQWDDQAAADCAQTVQRTVVGTGNRAYRPTTRRTLWPRRWTAGLPAKQSFG